MGEVATLSPKHRVEQLLKQLPDNCGLEDIQHHLYVMQTIENRIEPAEEGHFVSQEEADQRMAKWITK